MNTAITTHLLKTVQQIRILPNVLIHTLNKQVTQQECSNRKTKQHKMCYNND